MSGLKLVAWSAVIAGIAWAAQGRAALLRESDIGGFAPSTFRARLIFQQGDAAARSEIEIWRSGADRTLVRMLDPRERGKYLLRLGADLWFLSPGTKQPVRLSPTHRVYGAATIDLLLGLRLAEDYRIAGTMTQPDEGGTLVVFDLEATSDAHQFASVRYTVREATARPVRAIYRLRSGRDATRVEFLEWSAAGRRYARVIEVQDLLRKSAPTRVEVVAFDEGPVPDGLFDLRDATARRALESGRGAPVSPTVF